MPQVTEGGLTLAVDEVRDGASQGSGGGVFFNPTQEFNRDLTVAVLRAYQDRRDVSTYLDATAASGVRGVRAGVEGYEVTCADVDPEAVELAARNLAAHDVDGEAIHRDARSLLYESRFDVVDVDPFGSPIPFADPALANTRHLVAVTATDTAPLCGAHFASGVRRYSTVPRNTDYHPEMGLRVLLSALVRTAARYDVAATPVCSHVTRHYARTYLELDGGAQAADAVLENLGHLYHCEDCLHREADPGLVAAPPRACPACEGDRLVTAGPVWLGPVRDRAFLASVTDALGDGLGTAEAVGGTLATLRAELDTPTHYDQHRLCKQWGRPASKMDAFLSALREAGFDASRAHYHGTAFKTDATIEEMRAATADL
jgi:tRNA (guanine26-N2/guanine27-N2)-dimethyltransferase